MSLILQFITQEIVVQDVQLVILSTIAHHAKLIINILMDNVFHLVALIH